MMALLPFESLHVKCIVAQQQGYSQARKQQCAIVYQLCAIPPGQTIPRVRALYRLHDIDGHIMVEFWMTL